VNDIVNRLRKWAVSVDAVPASDLMDEAADVIASLRKEIRAQRQEIAALHAERSALLEAERPETGMEGIR
jgi:hypothetical protein